jgi:hypothetical protein
MRYTEAQMKWLLSRGLAWAEGPLDEWEWNQPLYTKRGAFLWLPVYISSKTGMPEGGYYEQIW